MPPPGKFFNLCLEKGPLMKSELKNNNMVTCAKSMFFQLFKQHSIIGMLQLKLIQTEKLKFILALPKFN